MKKYGSKYALIAIAMAVLLLAASIAGVFLPRKYTALDMTAGRIYKISDTTKQFLSELDTDVTIYVIDADTTQKKFEEYLKRYAECSDRITLEYVNSSENESVAAMLAEYGFSTAYPPTAYSLLICSDARTQFLDFSGLFTYSNEKLGFTELSASYYNYYAQLFSSSSDYADYLDALLTETEMDFHGEMALTQLIEYVSADIIPQAYFMTGHGEDSVTDGNFAALLNYYGYPFGIYDASSDGGVPADAACLIINEPKEDFTAEQVDMLIDYLASGGNMMLLLSPECATMTNLSALTAYCGFSVGEGVVMENVKEETESEEGAEETEGVPSDTVSAIINIDHDIFASVTTASFSLTEASAITVSESLRRAQLVTPIVATSDKAYIEGSEAVAPYILGVATEEETDAGNMRVVCFTGAESFNSKESSADALTLPVCALSWVAEGFVSEIEEIPPTLYQEKYLSISRERAIYLGLMFAIVLPACVVGFGVASCKSRKKK